MEKLKRLREARGLSQVKLAARADLNPATVNQIERGMRDASPGTLRKLADALEVSLYELMEEEAPKALAPSPEVEQGRRFAETFDLLERLQERRQRQVQDEASPHFRDATTAALWIADAEEEAAEILRWIVEYGQSLSGGWEDLLEIAAAGLSVENPAKAGRMRLQEMADVPDELAARRMEKATAERQEAVEELRKFTA